MRFLIVMFMCLATSLASVPVSGQTTIQDQDIEYFDCLIEPKSILELSTAVDGVVEEVLVDRGERVEKGQLLARLESTIQQAQYEIAKVKAENDAAVQLHKTRLDFAERRLKRNSSLISSNVLTEKEADEIRTARDAAEWELKQAEWETKLAQTELLLSEAQLQLREVRSPVAGYVVERNLEPGESTSQSYIFKLAELDPLHVTVFVSAYLLDQVEVDEMVKVHLEESLNTSFEGKVSIIDRIADAASGMSRIRVLVDNKNYDKPTGLKCRATFPSISFKKQ